MDKYSSGSNQPAWEPCARTDTRYSRSIKLFTLPIPQLLKFKHKKGKVENILSALFFFLSWKLTCQERWREWRGSFSFIPDFTRKVKKDQKTSGCKFNGGTHELHYVSSRRSWRCVTHLCRATLGRVGIWGTVAGAHVLGNCASQHMSVWRGQDLRFSFSFGWSCRNVFRVSNTAASSTQRNGSLMTPVTTWVLPSLNFWKQINCASLLFYCSLYEKSHAQTSWLISAAFVSESKRERGTPRTPVRSPNPPLITTRLGEKVWREHHHFPSHCFIDKNDLGSRGVY